MRRPLGTDQPFQPDVQPFVVSLFVDKPAFFYSDADQDELIADGITAFDPLAELMNRLAGGVEWRSLDYILKHLYLEKRNDDGSMVVRMYGNDLILKMNLIQNRSIT